jgi:hypothetical protein
MKNFRLKVVCVVALLFAGVFQLAAFAAESPWTRAVVIGASASSGFSLSEPLGGAYTDQCRLSPYLDAAITAPHPPVKNLALALLFLSPEAIAAQEIEAATNSHPTLVIAVDFLFWFCYGNGRTDAERAARFESGLKLLDHLPCPLIVGDIPDAASATNSGIISAGQVPSAAARAAANLRLRAWANNRGQVTVVCLGKIMQAVKSNAAIQSRHVSVPAGESLALLQDDQLHPNPRGAAMLALAILDAFITGGSESLAAEVDWDLKNVSERGRQAALKPRLN